jgi:hypothetical protein
MYSQRVIKKLVFTLRRILKRLRKYYQYKVTEFVQTYLKVLLRDTGKLLFLTKFSLFQVKSNLKLDEQVESTLGQFSSPQDNSQMIIDISNKMSKPEEKKAEPVSKPVSKKRPQTSRIHNIRPVTSFRK